MNSRMDKYYEETSTIGSRTKKNEHLYQDISRSELDNINIESNAQVIGDNDSDIDIAKIKALLEKKYAMNESSKPSTLSMTEEQKLDRDLEEETKEYDLNAILAKAKLDKDVDYERERLKKIHDTQYDILKSLDIADEKSVNPKVNRQTEEDLIQLINTITEKELTRELNPLDILSDLKGDENTVVLDGVKNTLEKEDIKDAVKEEVKKEMDKSFYTNSLSFTQSDFDDFNDLKEDVESNKLLVKILLVVVAIAFIVGVVVLINSVFHLNWF